MDIATPSHYCIDENGLLCLCYINIAYTIPLSLFGINAATPSPCRMDETTPSLCRMDEATPSPCGMDEVAPSPFGLNESHSLSMWNG